MTIVYERDYVVIVDATGGGGRPSGLPMAFSGGHVADCRLDLRAWAASVALVAPSNGGNANRVFRVSSRVGEG
jgi:hypothetical protein